MEFFSNTLYQGEAEPICSANSFQEILEMAERIRFVAALGACMTMIFKKKTIEQIVDALMATKDGRVTLKRIAYAEMLIGHRMDGLVIRTEDEGIEFLAKEVIKIVDSVVVGHFALVRAVRSDYMAALDIVRAADSKPIIVHDLPVITDSSEMPSVQQLHRGGDFRGPIRRGPTEIRLADLPVRRSGGDGSSESGAPNGGLTLLAAAIHGASSNVAPTTQPTAIETRGSASMSASAVLVEESHTEAAEAIEGHGRMESRSSSQELTPPQLNEEKSVEKQDQLLQRGEELFLTWFAANIGVKETTFDLKTIANRLDFDDWFALIGIVSNNINLRPYRKRFTGQARTAARRGADEFVSFMHVAVQAIIADVRGAKEEITA